MGIGLIKSYQTSSSHHPHTVARLCNQFNHVFAVLISIPHFVRNNFYQARPNIELLLQKNCKHLRGLGALPPDPQWFPAARDSALHPKAQPFHFKFQALYLASSQYWKCKCVTTKFLSITSTKKYMHERSSKVVKIEFKDLKKNRKQSLKSPGK